MKGKPHILIVDDEKNTRDGLQRALRPSYRVSLAESGERALTVLSEGPVDVLLSDIRMPGMDGMELMQKAAAKQGGLICILLTAYGSIQTAVEAMKKGAYDFLTKPVNLDHLDLLIKRALQSRSMEDENTRLRKRLDSRYGMENIIGQSAPMQAVLDTVRQVADTRSTVLIQGESGTGKELVAHALHQLSSRARGPFIAVHCAALTHTLLESELFGHERGAFTGAQEQRKGRFELADGGTLFLDEIGEIDPQIQIKILRVLEEHQFERVGGQQTLRVDVRLLAATNRDLKQMVDQGTFREDLYYRLNVVPVHLPALRERPEDIPALTRHFLDEICRQNNRRIEGLTPDAMDVLGRYPWPGNVRELRNVVENMVVLSRGDRLTVRDIPPAVRDAVQPGAPARSMAELSMQEAEKQLIVQALRQHNGNRTRAAEHLGISRRTLHRKLNEYGLRGTDQPS